MSPRGSFRAALREVWAEPQARRFTVFVFVSMLAYSAQDLILEPFAGIVFGMTPGASTQLAGLQNGGVLLGMVLVGVARHAGAGARPPAALRLLDHRRLHRLGARAVRACVPAGSRPAGWPLRANVFALGVANGVFAVAAIGSMMALAGAGRGGREGVRMGLWGAAQAIAFALGRRARHGGRRYRAPVHRRRGLCLRLVFAAEALRVPVGGRDCRASSARRESRATAPAGRRDGVPANLPYAREMAE